MTVDMFSRSEANKCVNVSVYVYLPPVACTCGLFLLCFSPKMCKKTFAVNKTKELNRHQRKVKLRNQLLLDFLRHWFNKSENVI